MCLFEKEEQTTFHQGCHVGATQPGMKKDRIGEDASTARSMPQLCSEPVSRLIGMCAGTAHCCPDEKALPVRST